MGTIWNGTRVTNSYILKSDQTAQEKIAVRKKQEALNAFLLAADALAQQGQVIEAEVRFKEALKTAEREFGTESDQAILVASIMAAFYSFQNRTSEAEICEARLKAWQMKTAPVAAPSTGELGKKFGQKRNEAPEPSKIAMRIPSNLRKHCQVLGLPLDSPISPADVNAAWKKQMLHTSAHPDLGGNTDEAVLLNQAKESLLGFFEERAPKLGSKFKK